MKHTLNLLLLAALLAMAFGAQGATPVKAAATCYVAIFAADNPAWAEDVRTKVVGAGTFTSVDLYDIRSYTPTLAELQAYDAVFVYSNPPYYDSVALGNNLADYLDGGGGLVLATFSFWNYNYYPGGISGRLVSGGYLPFTPNGQEGWPHLTLVADLPAHPILNGVSSFDGGNSSYHNTVALASGATQVAHWSDNHPLIATKEFGIGKIVGLNFYPTSSDAASYGFWDSSTDGARIMANAISWAGCDTTPPIVNVPGPMFVEATGASGATVDFVVTATDEKAPPSPAVTCDWLSGSLFPIGTTTVNCSATDAAGNVGTNSFDITVQDTTPPTLDLPAPITVEADGPAGSVVTFSVGATDIVDPAPSLSCDWNSGDTFPLGTTLVTCNAQDWAGNVGTGAFSVTVQDTTAPVLSLPAPITVEADGPAGTVVTYSVSATDDVDPAPAIACDWNSGDTFPVGMTLVTCTATDSQGNSSNGSFSVTVQDTVAPIVSVPADIVAEATGPAGADVTFTASATDTVDPLNPSVSCVPASGSTFPVGTTSVLCSATDTAGNTGSNSFNVTVQDTVAPTLAVPADITVEANDPAGTVVTFAPTAVDAVDTSPVITCIPPSGFAFPLGPTTVSCTATDYSGNSSEAQTFTVTVVDTTAPVLNLPANMTVTPTTPTGATVNFTATATDLGGPANPAVACDPPSGSFFPIGTTTVNCSATDSSGNTAYGSFTITVLASGNLLGNPGYDQTARFPYAWQYSVPTVPFSSLVDCTLYNLSASCSLKLIASQTVRMVTQTANYAGAAGDQFSFGLYSKAMNIPAGGDYYLEVSLFDGTNRVMPAQILYFNNGTHGFEMANASLTAPAAFDKIRFRIYFQKSAGVAWFDDAFIYKLP
ncbi:MAG: HYR domain-containing protein [Chloroflexota bacterium]